MKIMKDLTRERALELHRQMWTDMRNELGDCPTKQQRHEYKRNWIVEHFPELETDNCDVIRHNCFLCEYVNAEYGYCECLVEWPEQWCEEGENECDERNWQYMPISDLLALPERDIEEEEEE